MSIQIRVPELGESVVEATVGHWLKQEGDPVVTGETVVELETDKVDLEVGAEQAGILTHIFRKEGEDVKVGDVLGEIVEMPEPAAVAPAPPGPGVKPEAQAGPARKDGDEATPVARRLAEEKGVDLSQVPGSGPGGRVTRQDVEAFIEHRVPAAKPQEPAKAPVPPPPPRPEMAPVLPPPKRPEAPPREPAAPPSGAAGRPTAREERVRMSRRRRTIAQRLVEAHQTAAMLTTFNEIDMSAVMEIRRRRREEFMEKHGVSLGLLSFFVKATIGALKQFPRLNAEIQGEEIVLKHYYDIGIAVGAEEGLVVPVLRDADRMTFAEIEQAVKGLAQRAQEGTLTLDELRGGTFTITNGGVFGSLLSTPILNFPEVAILGLHKIEERPIAVEGQVVIHPMMYVALSYDHRIVDGREAVQFLARVKELVEDPAALLIEG